MKYILIAIAVILLSAFCFVKAEAQVSIFGTNSVNGFSKTPGTLWLSKYADPDSLDNIAAFDVEGKVYKTSAGTLLDTSGFLKKTDTSRSGIVTTYFYVDSLFAAIPTPTLQTVTNAGATTTNSVTVDKILVTNPTRTTTADSVARYNTTTKEFEVVALPVRIPYSDTTSLIPTKAFLLLNYFKNGGNTWGATWSLGSTDNRAGFIKVNNVDVMDFFTGGGIGVKTNGTNSGWDFEVNGHAAVRTQFQVRHASDGDNILVDFSGGAPRVHWFNMSAIDGTITVGLSRFLTNIGVDVTGNLSSTLGMSSGLAGVINPAGSMLLWGAVSTSPYLEFATTGSSIMWHVGSETVTGDLLFKGSPSSSTSFNGTEFLRVARASGKLTFPATITAAGTTGNQTINKPTGTVNIAGGGTTVTVTNNTVVSTSQVFAQVKTNDATAYVKNVVVSAGSFVINLGAAATGEVAIQFHVEN